MKRLTSDERLRLLRFVCSFAWSDLEVSDAERRLVEQLVASMGLPEDEVAVVREWLEHPPAVDDLDPQDIPREHRELFLAAAHAMIAADGEVNAAEAENYEILKALLA